MMKKGSVSIDKHGGAHNFVYEIDGQLYYQNQFRFVSTSDADAKSGDNDSVETRSNYNCLEQRKDGVLVLTTAPKRTNECVKKEENEDVAIKRFELVKPEVHLSSLDTLDMDTTKDSNIPTSLSLGMDSGSDLTDHLADFVFTSSLPDSERNNGNNETVGLKPEFTNYMEILESGDHLTPSNEFSVPSVSWGSNLHLSQPLNGMSTTEILVQPHNILAHYNPETSMLTRLNDIVDVHTSCSSGSNINVTAGQNSSSLFGTPGIRSEVSDMKAVQYPSSNFVDGIIGLGSYSSDTSTSNATLSSPSHANSIALSLSKHIVDSGPFSNETDVANDLNQLPNFLGLDVYPASNSSSKDNTVPLSNNDALGLLEPIDQSSSIANIQIEHGHQIPSSLKASEDLKPSTAPDDHDQNLNVTTISISNDDEHATKILVNTHEGQQQMYVINTADLNQLQSATNESSISHFYFINDNHQEQAHHSGHKHSITSSESVISQANIAAIDQDTTQLQENSLLAPTEMSEIVLMPLTENSTKGTSSIPQSDSESEAKRPLKKLLVCPEPGCQKTFKKASKLKVHQMMHTGERPFKCTLMGCEWAFTTSNKLKRHLETHEGRKDFVCDKPGCGHRFTTIYNLNTHRKLHERPCTEPCPQDGCGESFPTKRQLDMHLRNVHAIEDHTFKCPEPGCEKVFFSSGCMGSHMKVHRQNMEDLRCKHPGCGKQFPKLCRLRQHQQLHSGEKPYVCTFQGCTWAFATASKLKRHQTKHTGYRKWTCSICQKQFQRSEHLKGHLITHSGDRPFVCPVKGCGNTFSAKSSLYVHLKKHDESGKTIVYHCPLENCNNFYANKASLRQHILVKHCSLPNKGNASGDGQIMSSWLSLLAGGEESYSDEAANHPPATATAGTHDALLASDFLTGGVVLVDPTMMNPSSENLPGDANTSGSTTTSSAGATDAAALLPQVPQQQPLRQQQQQQLQPKQILLQGLQLMDEQEFLQQQERMSHVAVERGKKSQIMLENVHGSARTDLRSNDIVSQRALQRWQKQKEEEAAKLRVKLDEQERARQPPPPVMVANGVPPSPSSMSASGDYKSPVSNNVSLGGRWQHQYFVVSKSSGFAGPTVTAVKEISDLAMEGEGLTDILDSDVGPDSFMTELFVRDPDSGMADRQPQLLQDDPPNHGLLEDMDSMGGLDVNFVEDSLTFHPME